MSKSLSLLHSGSRLSVTKSGDKPEVQRDQPHQEAPGRPALSGAGRKFKRCNYQSRRRSSFARRRARYIPCKAGCPPGKGRILETRQLFPTETRRKHLTTPNGLQRGRLRFPRLSPAPSAAPTEAQRGPARKGGKRSLHVSAQARGALAFCLRRTPQQDDAAVGTSFGSGQPQGQGRPWHMSD